MSLNEISENEIISEDEIISLHSEESDLQSQHSDLNLVLHDLLGEISENEIISEDEIISLHSEESDLQSQHSQGGFYYNSAKWGLIAGTSLAIGRLIAGPVGLAVDSAKGDLIAGTTAAIGGLIAGPVGFAVGATIGGVAAAIRVTSLTVTLKVLER